MSAKESKEIEQAKREYLVALLASQIRFDAPPPRPAILADWFRERQREREECEPSQR